MLGGGLLEPASPPKSSGRPQHRRCCGLALRRSSLLRVEKVVVALLVAYALCDLLLLDMNGNGNAVLSPSVSGAKAAPAPEPQGCAFVNGATLPAPAAAQHPRRTASPVDCCVACVEPPDDAPGPDPRRFYYDPSTSSCWCLGSRRGSQRRVLSPGSGAGDAPARRALSPGSGVVSGAPSCCRGLADSRAQNDTAYEDTYAKNYDIGDLNDDGMMSEREFAQFHTVADVNHDGMLTRGEFRHWLTRVTGSDEQGEAGGLVTAGLLLHVGVYQAVPLMGFGFLDNCIMIVAGEAIESGLGRTLRLTTLAAAGLGNLISDVAGLGLEDYVRLISGKIMTTYV